MSYSKGDPRLFAAVVVIDLATFEVIEVQQEVGKADFPYMTGLLAFREIPILCKVFRKIKTKPDVILC
jgi:deoxyribonuclease V